MFKSIKICLEMPLVEYTAKSAPYGLQHSQKIPLPFTAGQLGASTTLSLKKKPKKPQTCKPHSLYLSHPVANSSSFFLAERPEQLGSGSCLQPFAPEEQLVQIPEEFLVQTSTPAAAPAPGAAPGAAPAQAGESLPVFEQPGWGLMSPPGHIPAGDGCSTIEARHRQHLLPQGFVFCPSLSCSLRAELKLQWLPC